ncbi:MAG TPA: LEPR-XLL domain-containing protein, partial [Burkholderiales bacterium]|nr:LEPR-XLL domain-containing protein [Burkholderiales bacterium]
MHASRGRSAQPRTAGARRSILLEPIEPRLLLSADLTYGDPAAVPAPGSLTATDISNYVSALTSTTFTLKAEQSGSDFFWNMYGTGLDGTGTPALAGQAQITAADDLDLNLIREEFGLRNASIGLNDFIGDKITVDIDSLGVLNGQFAGTTIDIDFNGGKDIDLGDILGIELPLDLTNDQLILAGDGPLAIAHGTKVHSTSDIVTEGDADGLQATFQGKLEIVSDSKITIDGASLVTAPNMTLLADAKSTSGLFQGLLANASSAITLDDTARLVSTGGTIELFARSDVTFSEDGDTYFGDGLSATAVLSISSALVDIKGSTQIDAATVKIEGTIHTDVTATAQDSTVRVVTVNVFNTPEIKISGSADIAATSAFTALAKSDVKVTNTTVPTDSGTSTADAAVASSVVQSKPGLLISGGTIASDGDASFTASDKIVISSTADGKQGGSDNAGSGGAGATLAFSMMFGDTTASITGGSISADNITLAATSDRSATSLSNASKGGSEASGNSGNNRNASEKRLADPNNDGDESDQASTDEGSIPFAAAIAVGLALDDTAASITGGSVHATAGDLKVEATGKIELITTADGSNKDDDGSAAVGAAVAISIATPEVSASVGGTANLDGNNVRVAALVQPSKLETTATAGASGSGLGVAGSFALNVMTIDAYARQSGTVDVNGANVTLSAKSTTDSKAVAKAKVESGDATGVGASVSINILDNDVYAELVNGATLTEANDLTLQATSDHGMVTQAKGGAAGGTAVTPVVAIAIGTVDTQAKLGTDGETLTLTGALSAAARHDGASDTLADGEAAGGTAAVGAAVAVSYLKDTVIATSLRDIAAAGAVTFSAGSVGQNNTRAKASASGASDSEGGTSQSKADGKRDAGNTRAQNSGAAQASTTNKAEAKKSSDSNSGGDSVAVAAAIAINVVDSEVKAELPATVTVSAGGLLTVSSGSNVNGSAIADGKAADGGAAAIGAAVAVNTVDVQNKAVMSGTVTAADGMVVEAVMLDRKMGLQTAQIDIVDTSDDTIFLGTEHGLVTGQKVKYHKGDGGTAIGGLSDNTDYYVRDVGGGKIKLYDSKANADAGGATGLRNLTDDGAGSKHYFGKYIEVPLIGEVENPLESGKVKFDPDPNQLRVLELGSNHGLRTGDAVVYHKGTGAAVGGLTDDTTYYVIVLDDKNVQLAETRQKALDGDALELTSDDVDNDDFLTEATHSTFASSTSGGGGGDVGIAGSVAINRAAVVTTAEVGGDATLLDGSADGDSTIGVLSVRAHSTTDNTARAVPHGDGGVADSVGVGASFALNLGYNDTTAELKDGGDVTGSAGSITVEAIGSHRTSTEAKNGAKGDSAAVGGAVAVTLSESDTKARAGTGATLNTGGAASVTAQHTQIVDTRVSSEARSSSAAVGASVGVNYIADTNQAVVARNLAATGGGVTLHGTLALTAAVDVHASAGGGDNDDGDGDSADSKSSQSVNNNSNTGGGKNTQSASGNANSANSDSSSQSGSGGSGVGVAASVGVSVVTVSNSATVTNGADVSGSGAVSISAQASADAKAQSDAMAVDLTNGDVSVAAAVSFNYVTLANTATVSGNSVVDGAGVTLEAVTTASERNDFVATAYSLGGNKGGTAAVAGAIAINVVDIDTTAQADDGATIKSTGAVNVTAEHQMGLQSIAAAGAGSGDFAIGGAVAIDIVGTGTGGSSTIASIGEADGDDAGATVQANGTVAVNASHSIAMTGVIDLPQTLNDTQGIDDPDFLSIGSAAVSAALGAGGTGIAGSAGIHVFETTTQARVERGTVVEGYSGGGSKAGGLTVGATDTTSWTSVAGSVGIGTSGAGVGAGLDVTIIDKNTKAYVGRSSDVDASGAVSLTASSSETLIAVAASGGVSSSAGIGASAAVQVITTNTRAYVEDGSSDADKAQIDAGSMTVHAGSTFKTTMVGGAIGVGSTAGVGAANSTLVHTGTTEAYLGDYIDVNAAGTVAVTAVASEDVLSISAAGAGGGTAGVAGSAAVNVLEEHTTAYVGHDANLTITGAGHDLVVSADDDTWIISVAGSLAAGATAGVGVGADVGVYTKDTNAFIDSGVVATVDGHVKVLADSSENLITVSAGLAAGTAGVSANAGVHIFDLSTRAFIGDDPLAPSSAGAGDVHAKGSLVVSANDYTNVNEIAGTIAAGAVGIGAAAGVNVITKETVAFIGDGAKVTGDGGGDAVSVNTGRIGAGSDNTAPVFDSANPSNVGIETNGSGTATAAASGDRSSLRASGQIGTPDIGAMDLNADSSQEEVQNDSLTGKRTTSLGTDTDFRGVSVSATNRDEIRTFTFSLAAGTVGVAVSAGVSVVNATTEASIGDSAKVNESTANANAAQEVLVGAGSDFFHLAVAGTLAAGAVGVAPAVGVNVIGNTTNALIGSSAVVNAKDDISVLATSSEDLVMIGFGIAAGAVGVGGAVDVLSIDNHTTASIGASATVFAGGDVFVSAVDDTSVLELSGALGAGFVGVGGSVGVMLVDKDTEASIGAGAKVDALGGGSSGVSDVINGEMASGDPAKTTARGVIVQAESSEDIMHIVAAGGAGFVGVSGAVGITLINADTEAAVRAGALVNTLHQDSAGGDQSVFVNAANEVEVQTFVLGVAGGFVGVAGAVDVGTLNNNTKATVETGAQVRAKEDIEVNAVATKDLSGIDVSGSGGFVGVGGAVSVWSVGKQIEKSTKDADGNDTGSAMDSGGGAADADAAGQAEDATGTLTKSGSNGSDGGGIDTFAGDGSGNDKTNQNRVSAATASASTSINTKAPSSSAISTKLNAAPTTPPGTSAVVQSGAALTADDAIEVRAHEVADIAIFSGQASAGVVGAGASVAILSVANNVAAFADGTLSAGGAITVRAELHSDIELISLSGSAGFVGIGAAVAVLNDSSLVQASIGSVTKAGSVTVEAIDDRVIDQSTGQVSAGAVAAGASYTRTNVTGGATAQVIGGAQIGQGADTVGSLAVTADSNIDADTQVTGVTAGAAGATANFAFVEVHPLVEAKIGDNAKVTTVNAIDVNADSHHRAEGEVLGVAVTLAGGASLSWTDVKVTPTVSSTLGANASARSNSGGVNFRARHNAGADDGDKKVIAEATAASGSIGLAGAGGRAQGIHSAVVSASGGSGSTVSSAGQSGFLAHNVGVVEGFASGGAGALVGGLSVMDSTMKSEGSATVTFSGTANDSGATASSFKLSAVGTRFADGKDFVISVGALFGGAAAFSDVHAGGTTSASLGGSSTVNIGGTLTVEAAALNSARAKTEGGAGGLIGAALLKATANSIGTTESKMDDGADVTKAGNVNVHATDNSFGTANAVAGTGGAVSAGGVLTTANVKPTITAKIGNNATLSGVTGNIDVSAESAQAEGDATAAVYGGGLVQVGAAQANGDIEPNVAASIGTGTTIDADGDVTVRARQGYTPPAIALTDFFDAGAVNYATDTVTFTAHGLATGDSVVYFSDTPAPIALADGDTLQDNREYAVIVRSADTFTFGAQFAGAQITNAVALVQTSGAVGVDPVRDMIRFATPHKFANGDVVRYSTDNASVVGGLNEATTYYVQVVDAFTIKLFTSEAHATAAPVFFTVDDVSSNRIDTQAFNDGDRVTYRDPAPILFRSSDVNTDANFAPFDWTPDGYDGDNDDIFVGRIQSDGTVLPHNFEDGEKVIYRTNAGAADEIGGLNDGGVYYVLTGEFDPYRIQLYTDPNDDSTIVDLTGSHTTDPADPNYGKNLSQHWLVRPSLGVLQDGRTYVVINKDADGIQLATEDNPAVALSLSTADRSGTFNLSRAGIALTHVAGDAPHELIIDMSSGSGQQKLLGPGSISPVIEVSLRSITPPGDGQSAVSARGGGGGVFAIGDPDSQIIETATIGASLNAASVVAGGNVNVLSTADGNASSYAINSGGGFIQAGNTDATTIYAAKNDASIGNGVIIEAGRDLVVNATTSSYLYARAVAEGGGFLAFADA